MSEDCIRVAGAYIELTSKCNYNCIYCYNDSTQSGHNFINFDDYVLFISQLIKVGLKTIALSGGEPFLHPSFLDILDMNKQLGLRQVVITNGSRLNDTYCKKLVYVDAIVKVTIDGSDEDTNDKTRGQGTFSNAVKTLQMFNANSMMNNVFVRCNLSYNNIDRIDDIISFCTSHNVRNIDFSLIVNIGRAIGMRLIDNVQDTDILEAIEDKIKQAITTHNINITFDYQPTLQCPYENINNAFNIRIDSAGDIFPCQQISNRLFILGNVADFSLDSFYDNVRNFSQLVQERPINIASCKKCVLRGACHGGCVASSMNKFGTPEKVDGLCGIRKDIVFKALRDDNKYYNTQGGKVV